MSSLLYIRSEPRGLFDLVRDVSDRTGIVEGGFNGMFERFSSTMYYIVLCSCSTGVLRSGLVILQTEDFSVLE
jgi:hypothetical protein